MTIALDAMGGDHGPSVIVPAALYVLSQQPMLRLILVGDSTILKSQLQANQASENDRLQIKHATQQVEMDELPSLALRNKKDSSMRVAIELVKSGTAHACVSAGNTGALMAIARFVLKTLPGIDRPAIIAQLPTMKDDKRVRVLDLGANVDSKPEHLLQFAVMGTVLTSAIDNISRPTLGLLNIGSEEIKGNDLVKQTARLLQDSAAINYIGYIEGDAVYKGDADIVVCDGFVGNVALKASEGLARLVLHCFKQEFDKNWFTRLCGLISMPILKASKRRIDPARFNGATLIGLQGIVIKSHGSADKFAFANAINEALLQVKENVPQRIRDQVGQLLMVETPHTSEIPGTTETQSPVKNSNDSEILNTTKIHNSVDTPSS